MANQVLNVLTDRFNSLIAAPKAWLLYLPSQPYLNKGDILTVREVDSLGNYLGRYRTGVCAKTSTEQFIVYAKGTQCYYFTPLSMAVQIYTNAIIKTNVSVSHTGDILETVLFSQLIPAGTIAANDWLRILLFCSANATAGAKSVKVWLNTANNLAGATQIGMVSMTSASIGRNPMVRNYIFQNSVASFKSEAGTGTILSDESVIYNTAITTFTNNFAVDQYMIVSGKLGVNTDTVTLNGMVATLTR